MSLFISRYGKCGVAAALLFALVVVAALMGTSVPASALCVHRDRANLRSGPGTKYEKTWEVYQYMPLKKIGAKDGWHHVRDVDGEKHWILGSLATSSFRCAVVKDDEANIRTGPGTDFPQLAYSPVLRYATFKVLRVSGEWVEVEDSFGDRGWIYAPLLWIE